MHKRIINDSAKEEQQQQSDQKWLNIESLVEVEISSEDAEFPIESALLSGNVSGWRALEPGEQIIRLVFIDPHNIKTVMLNFDESNVERTQEYVLCWSNEDGVKHEILKQQWNFSPMGATKQIESHHVNLSNVKVLELSILPDISGGDALATLQAMRIA